MKPLRGRKYLMFLKACVKLAESWPVWVKGERGNAKKGGKRDA